MELYLKHPSNMNGGYQILNEDYYMICQQTRYDRGLCHEYDIIEKINKNEEESFYFSKNLIDVGPEDGGYSIFCNFNKSYCFEPNKDMCCLIYANMYLKNKVNNTIVYNSFLSNKEEYVKFDGFEAEGTVNFNKSEWKKYDDYQMIKSELLDSYNIQNVGLIKVDTEGYDYQVLNGSIKTIKENNYPPIIFENWNIGQYGWSKESHDKLNNFIESLGYTIFEKWGSDDTHLAIKLNK